MCRPFKRRLKLYRFRHRVFFLTRRRRGQCTHRVRERVQRDCETRLFSWTPQRTPACRLLGSSEGEREQTM